MHPYMLNCLTLKGHRVDEAAFINPGTPGLTVGDLKMSVQGKSDFEGLKLYHCIYRKAAQSGHSLLLNTNRKSHMGSAVMVVFLV